MSDGEALHWWELLLAGRYAEAWPLFDERESRLRVLPKMSVFPEWRGEHLAGRRLLIVGEQGIGDEVMLARFVPKLRALGAERIVVAAHPANLRLFRALGVEAVADRTLPRFELPTPDCWVMLGSLPRWLGVEPSDIPGEPYLSAQPLAGARGDGEGGRGIGIAWHGQRDNPRDVFRSLPCGDVLLALPGARELAPCGDTVDSLAQLAGLDLVITVDTAWAHLAGALGTPVWILLPRRGVDWRWRREGATTPWYPSARLFRQAVSGDWGPVLAQVAEALQAEASDARGPAR